MIKRSFSLQKKKKKGREKMKRRKKKIKTKKLLMFTGRSLIVQSQTDQRSEIENKRIG